MIETPNFRFSINKFVNLFYHVSVLFYEYFPDEYSLGILNNSPYRQQYGYLKTESLHRKFQSLYRSSFYTWDFIGKSLYEANSIASTEETLQSVTHNIADIWLEILSEALPKYESIWAQTEPKLREYESNLEAEWNPICKSVLANMTNMTKLAWDTELINVRFVDCVYGGSAWMGDILLPPFPEADVEKKLLTHEIAHILMPEYVLKTKLQSLGLDYAISHTIVDLVAYFGVKEHVTDPERRGIKPNPNYYDKVPELYPVFEKSYKNHGQYHNFDEILSQIKL